MQRSPCIRTRNEHSNQMMALNENPSNSTSQTSINYNFTEAQFRDLMTGFSLSSISKRATFRSSR